MVLIVRFLPQKYGMALKLYKAGWIAESIECYLVYCISKEIPDWHV